jgi:hypothetical protein
MESGTFLLENMRTQKPDGLNCSVGNLVEKHSRKIWMGAGRLGRERIASLLPKSGAMLIMCGRT